MNTENRENDDDRAAIVYNEAIENTSQHYDLRAVISNHQPKKRFIEPAIFFSFAGFSLFELVIPNAVELQYCRTALNLTQQQCFSDTINPVLKEEYEKFASMFNILRSVIEVTIPCILSFFIGPWSDTYGRKPLIVSSLIGFSVMYGLWTFASSITTLSPMNFLFFSLPLAFSGGTTALILGVFCYACDVSTLENRASSLGRLQAVLFLGSLVGAQLCPLLLPYGYTVVFGVSSAFIYLSLIYVAFCLDESIIPSQVELNSPKRNPFHLHHIKELFECCYTKQPSKIRFTMFLLTLILSCSLINAFGEVGILYLFLQRILNWDVSKYTVLNSYGIIVNALGAYLGTLILCEVLKLDDLLVLSIAAFLRVLSALVMIFGYEVWHIYLAKLLSCTMGISGSVIRSFLSRIIPPDELGKVFSLLASTESATPLFSSLLYSTLFNMTMETIPGAVFYLSAILMLVMLYSLVILVAMYVPDSIGVSSVGSRFINRNTSVINED